MLLLLVMMIMVGLMVLKVVSALNPPVKVLWLSSSSSSSFPVGSHFHTGAEIGRGSGGGQTISSYGLFSQPRNFVVELWMLLLVLLLLTMMLVGGRG